MLGAMFSGRVKISYKLIKLIYFKYKMERDEENNYFIDRNF